jgi:hypothetical protein
MGERAQAAQTIKTATLFSPSTDDVATIMYHVRYEI